MPVGGRNASPGPKTEQAVKSFQGSSGLVVDGAFGPATWGAMPADPGTVQLKEGRARIGRLRAPEGAAGLRRRGAPTDPGAIDGDFGPKTDGAVRAHQGDRGVGVDGVVGDRTWWSQPARPARPSRHWRG